MDTQMTETETTTIHHPGAGYSEEIERAAVDHHMSENLGAAMPPWTAPKYDAETGIVTISDGDRRWGSYQVTADGEGWAFAEVDDTEE